MKAEMIARVRERERESKNLEKKIAFINCVIEVKKYINVMKKDSLLYGKMKKLNLLYDSLSFL